MKRLADQTRPWKLKLRDSLIPRQFGDSPISESRLSASAHLSPGCAILQLPSSFSISRREFVCVVFRVGFVRQVSTTYGSRISRVREPRPHVTSFCRFSAFTANVFTRADVTRIVYISIYRLAKTNSTWSDLTLCAALTRHWFLGALTFPVKL